MDYDSTMARVALIHPTRRNFTITVLSERNRHKRSYCVIFFPSCGKEAQWNWLYAGIVKRPNLNPVGTSAGREKVVPGRGGKELKGSWGALFLRPRGGYAGTFPLSQFVKRTIYISGAFCKYVPFHNKEGSNKFQTIWKSEFVTALAYTEQPRCVRDNNNWKACRRHLLRARHCSQSLVSVTLFNLHKDTMSLLLLLLTCNRWGNWGTVVSNLPKLVNARARANLRLSGPRVHQHKEKKK